MSIVVKLRQAIELNGCVVAGDQNVDVTLPDTNEAAHTVIERLLPDNFGTALLWDATSTPVGSPDAMFILSDAAVVVELTTNHSTPEYIVLFVRANELTALPMFAGGNTTESIDGLVLVSGTDFKNVVKVRVQRDVADAIGDAKVSLYVFD